MIRPLANWWQDMTRDVFPLEVRRDVLDIVSRMFVGFLGVIWFGISLLNIGLGMRELSFSFQEWVYFAYAIAGILLIALSCLPFSLLSRRAVRWSVVPIIVFVEIGLAMIAVRLSYRLYRVYSFGMGIASEPASTRMTKLAFAAATATALGVALAFGVARLFARAKQR